MANENESGEKTNDPTPKKLADARKKGDIAKSNDLTIAMIYFGFFIAILVAGSAPSAMQLPDCLCFCRHQTYFSTKF